MTDAKQFASRLLAPRSIVSIAIIGIIAVGGGFVPWLGLAVPAIVIVALVTNVKSRRFFCARLCPRAALLESVGPAISAYRPLPKAFRSPMIRALSCAMLAFCSIAQLSRLLPDFRALGAFFWAICLVTLAASVAMALSYKPRAWCAVCPVGALQDALTRRQARDSEE